MTISALWGWADLPPPPHQMLKDTHWEQLDTFCTPAPRQVPAGAESLHSGPPNSFRILLIVLTRSRHNYLQSSGLRGLSFLGGMGGARAEPCSAATGSRVLQGGM